jgi:hypothetical protein
MALPPSKHIYINKYNIGIISQIMIQIPEKINTLADFLQYFREALDGCSLRGVLSRLDFSRDFLRCEDTASKHLQTEHKHYDITLHRHPIFSHLKLNNLCSWYCVTGKQTDT